MTVVSMGSSFALQVWHEGLGLGNTTAAQGTASTGAHFGFALSAGNFNGDNYDDLAIGTPGKGLFIQTVTLGAGIVHTIYGAPDGLTIAGEQVWNQSSPGLGEAVGTEEHFGTALASGDFNGDGSDDLAVGVPDENMSGFVKSGLVHTILGSSLAGVGDFDGDGQLTIADIDQLTEASAGGNNDAMFDLTGDGLVNAADIEYWVVELKGTQLGDANLDGQVNGADFDIWMANRFRTLRLWSRANFNGDQYVDGRDLLIWNTHKVQLPPPSATSGAESRDIED